MGSQVMIGRTNRQTGKQNSQLYICKLFIIEVKSRMCKEYYDYKNVLIGILSLLSFA